MASTLSGPQPTGLLLRTHEDTGVRDACGAMESPEGLVARIVIAADKINTTPGMYERVRESLIRRCGVYNYDLGRHF